MRFSEIATVLKCMYRTKRPTFLWGAPGVGKDAVTHSVATALGVQVTDVRLSLLDPVDLRGLPNVTKGVTTWCPPSFLPKSGEGILFLNELAQAPTMVQAACLQLALDRKCGEYTLPDGWYIMAASNRGEDRAGTHRIITPLLNRFVHIDMEVSLDDWQEWAVKTTISPEIRAFLRFKPNMLHSFKPDSHERAFPTPRSWQFASDILTASRGGSDTLPENLLLPTLSGTVGEGAAAELMSYLTLYGKLPDAKTVLKQAGKHDIPNEPSVLYALVSSLVEAVRNAPEQLDNFCTYGRRMPPEFGVLAMNDYSAVAGSKVFANKNLQDWIRDCRAKGVL